MFVHDPVDFGQTKLERQNVDGIGRFYRVNDALLPSVTTALKILSEEAIAEWRAKVGEEEANRVSSKASTQGNIVHNLMEQYVLNEEPDTHKLAYHHIEMFRGLQQQVDQHLGRVFGVEQRLYSEVLGVAGTADLLAEWDGVPSVIDYKTSNKPKRLEWINGYLQQSACYSFMAYERARLHLPQVVILIACSSTGEVQTFKANAREHLDLAVDTITRFNEKIASG